MGRRDSNPETPETSILIDYICFRSIHQQTCWSRRLLRRDKFIHIRTYDCTRCSSKTTQQLFHNHEEGGHNIIIIQDLFSHLPFGFVLDTRGKSTVRGENDIFGQYQGTRKKSTGCCRRIPSVTSITVMLLIRKFIRQA